MQVGDKGRISTPRCRSVAWFLLAGICLTSPIEAELVLLVGGGVLKVESFERQGEQMSLQLPAGGTLILPVLRIDRILADEIESETPSDLPDGDLDFDFRPRMPVPETPFGELIFSVARRYSINPGLVAAMVETESAFDPHAVSRKGAMGLLQLMPATAVRFGLTADNVFDPQHNLDAGVRYLRWLADRFAGDVTLALAGYNAGEAAVERYGGIPPYAETRNYVRKVYSAALRE